MQQLFAMQMQQVALLAEGVDRNQQICVPSEKRI